MRVYRDPTLTFSSFRNSCDVFPFQSAIREFALRDFLICSATTCQKEGEEAGSVDEAYYCPAHYIFPLVHLPSTL